MFIGTKRSLLNAAWVLSGSFILRGAGSLFNVANVITGSLGLNKFGNSRVNFTGLSTFTGNTNIYAGTLAFAGTASWGGGTYTGSILNNGILIHGSTANQTFSGVLSGTGSLQQTVVSTTTLSNTNTFSGGTTVTNGAVAANADAHTGTGSILLNGGILRTTSAGYTLGASKTITIGASGGTLDCAAGSFNRACALATNGQLLGSGQLTITASNSGYDALSIRAYQNVFTGNILISSGRLQISTTDPGTGGNTLIGSGTITITAGTLGFAVDIGGSGSNTLNNNITVQGSGDAVGAIHSKSTGIATLNGTVAMTANTKIGNDQTGGGPIVFNGVISGAFNLNIGSGKAYFNATNTFSSLTLSNGTTAGGSGTIPGTLSIPSASGTTLLAGTGNTAPATLNTSALTFAGALSNLSIPSNGTTTLGSINVTGTCALGGCIVNLLNTMSAGVYNIIVASSTMSGTLPTIGTNSSGKTPTLSQVGNNLVLTLV